jgi:hypothetical protein
MPVFQVEIPGQLYRYWPGNKEIKLLNCLFTPGDGSRDFIVRTAVQAADEDIARQTGRELCLDVTHLLEFCMNEEVDLSTTNDKISLLGASAGTGGTSISTSAATVLPIPPTTDQMESIAKAEAALEAETDAERRESLLRAIHWQALGRREVQSAIDRFMKFWIAIEVLVKGEGKYVVPKIKDQLMSLYPKANEQKVAETIGRIYGVRADIVHFGIRQPQNLHGKLEQLESILSDLLRTALGLKFKALAGRFLA